MNQKNQDGHLINDQIKAAKVRVIDDNGAQLGILFLDEAIDFASDKGMDLVQLNAEANPPVCKVLNYGKYRYRQTKKQLESKKKQKQVQLKEIKLRPMIGEHDLAHKKKRTVEFIKAGDKVKITVMFRGRELNFKENGVEILNKFCGDMEEIAVIEKEAKLTGKMASIIIAPKQTKST